MPSNYKMKERRADYARTFGSDHGKRVLHEILRFSHLLHPTYVRGDSYETAFREGERNIGLRVLTLLGRRAEDFPEFSDEVNHE
jgi:hypothetical protein